MKTTWTLPVSLILVGILGVGRVNYESREVVQSASSGRWIGSARDPRDQSRVEQAVNIRESESFRERMSGSLKVPISWPGLKALERSWVWLETLEGLHHPSSYDRDFSWLFSKLHTFSSWAPAGGDLAELNVLLSYVLVISRDGVGANLLLQDLFVRSPERWSTWFWSGFHALENQKDRKWAADLYGRAARVPGAPTYLASLTERLRTAENQNYERLLRDRMIRRDLPKDLADKLQRARPELFPSN